MTIKSTDELNDIDRGRGNIISNFAYIENLLSQIIIRHYIRDEELVHKMTADIFDGEGFTFYLKFKLFEMVLRKYYSEKVAELKYDPHKIRELGRLRNIIAHGRIETLGYRTNQNDIKYSEIFLVHGGEKYSAKEQIDKYNELKLSAQPKLEQLAKSLEMFEVTPIDPNIVTKSE